MIFRPRSESKPLEKQDKLTLIISLAALAVSILSLAASGVTAYFNVVAQADEISVVFDSTPKLFYDEKSKSITVQEPFTVVFINSGNRPASLHGVNVHLWESSKMRQQKNDGRWECHHDDAPAVRTIMTKHRVLDTRFESLVLKEKEIARRTFALFAGFRAGKDAKNERSRVTLPMPDWYKKEGDYWASVCVSFQFSTPTDAYASNSVDLDQPFGFDKNMSFEAFFTPPVRPFLIWKRSGTIFGY